MNLFSRDVQGYTLPSMHTPHRPIGVTAISVFFAFGATMSGLATIMLLFPASALATLWKLNPHAREGLTSLGFSAVLLMLLVCGACIMAALGLWRCKRFGLWVAVTILSVNLVGDTTNAFVQHDWRTLVGLPVGGVMILYLITKRRVFAT